jgi:hypothetical protein
LIKIQSICTRLIGSVTYSNHQINSSNLTKEIISINNIQWIPNTTIITTICIRVEEGIINSRSLSKGVTRRGQVLLIKSLNKIMNIIINFLTEMRILRLIPLPRAGINLPTLRAIFTIITIRLLILTTKLTIWICKEGMEWELVECLAIKRLIALLHRYNLLDPIRRIIIIIIIWVSNLMEAL